MRDLIFGVLVAMSLASTACSQIATTEPRTTPPPEALEAGPPDATVEALAKLTREQIAAMSVSELKSRARAAIEAESFGVADQLIREALSREGAAGDLELTLLTGEARLGMNDLSVARTAFTDVVNADPNDFRANLGLGALYLRGSRPVYRQATTYLERARELAVSQPDRVDALRLLAEAHLGNHQPVDAVRAGEEALQLDPDNFGTMFVLTQAYIDAGAFDSAIQLAKRLEERAKALWAQDRGNPTAVQRLAVAARTNVGALRNQTTELFERGADGQPTDRPAPGQEQRIAQLLEEVVRLETLKIEADRLLQLHALLGIAERATSYAPDRSDAWIRYGDLLAQTYQDQAARDAFQKALELDPDNEEASQRLRQLAPASAAR
jgi:tetratricopeptide (TPR) repeat protein